MEIRFLLRFSTKPGESFSIIGNSDVLGNNNVNKSLKMHYLNASFWEVKISLEHHQFENKLFTYKYLFHTPDGLTTEELENNRQVDITLHGGQNIELIDAWNYAGDINNVFYSTPFKNVFFDKLLDQNTKPLIEHFSHEFRVKAPLLKKDQKLVMLGNCVTLGNWKSENFISLVNQGDWFVAKLDLSKEKFPVEYKYAIYDKVQDKLSQFEDGLNRVLPLYSLNSAITILHDGFVRFPVDTWKAAGVAIPVFSLRSEESLGVGEFTDIKLLVDWAKQVGMKLIQLLPVNDTSVNYSWQDSYPYSAISAFALHPLYINLKMVAGEEYSYLIESLKKKQLQLEASPDVDYVQVMQLKLTLLEDLYQLDKESVFASAEYQQFYNENKDWLVAYAVFSYHRDLYKTANFCEWETFSTYNTEAIEAFVSADQPHADKIDWYYFTQFHLHIQLQEAHDYANANGIVLKGDIPIGISRNGVDAWMQPELYFMDEQAGAPPDDFAVKGQNWGFPTYNWQRMQNDDFAWWKRRFEQMNRYFDAFRIDHILGFFRIWSIPIHAIEGSMGRFSPAIPVLQNEFYQHKIIFNEQRFCKPFINDTVLEQMFGNNKHLLMPFLEEKDNYGYQLKEAYNTQVKVASFILEQTQDEQSAWLQQALFDLITNVILFVEQENQFHFRFGMEQTNSYKNLDTDTQQKLKTLYVDYFYRRQNDFWKKEGLKKLPGLKKSTEMLICGEDLGMVPDCVPEVMQQLGMLSLEIQRMPKSGHNEFFNPLNAPYLSVVTPSTHDMSTIRGWWEEDREKTQRFFNDELGILGNAPWFCEAWVNKLIVQQHIQSPSMWSIFQLQDLLGIDESLRRVDPNQERINVPAIPNYYWRYRMHITLEQLQKEDCFNKKLREMLEWGGRL
jgi:4-alpha-glucanotransferase